MFLDAINNVVSSTISIPISNLTDATGNVVSSIGVGVPSTAIPHLDKIGLSHKSLEHFSHTLFEPAGKTLTGHWMDATGPFKSLYPEGVSVGWHRIHGHHFITDGLTTINNSNLSFIDFNKHLLTDVVTKNGLPLLPGETVRHIASALSISPSQVMPWVSMNILDIGASILAINHAVTNVTSIMYGTAEWGLGYGLNTFGVGALEIASGVVSHNPILIGAGTVDIACGAIAAHDYYSQPFFCGVPINDILASSTIGIGISTIINGIDLAYAYKKGDTNRKLQQFGERVITAGILSGMSAIAVPLSITTGIGISGFKLAKGAADDTNKYIEAVPISGNLSKDIDQYVIDNYHEEGYQERLLKYLEKE